MNTVVFKIIAVLLIFAAGMAGGLLPLRIKGKSGGSRKMVLGNAFSAGVFLGAGLLHMLPDAQEKFSTFANQVEYPLAALLCGAGFLLILLLEKGLLGGREDIGETAAGNSFYALVLLLVLSVHSLIAGASLGLETEVLASTVIFIAIIGHKGAASFSLGVSLSEGGFNSRTHLGLVALFSLTVPLGVLAGTLFASAFSGTTDLVFEGVFDALAAGTFLYVGILEILSGVFHDQRGNWPKLALVLTGFGLMALIAIWT